MRFRRLLLSLPFLATLLVMQPAAQRAVAAGSPLATVPVKLSISQEGIYRVSGQDLVNAGIDLTSVAVNTLGLSDGGTAVPIFVSSAGASFAPGDYIEFYGHPVLNTYNSTNVYVLADNVSSPARVTSVAASPSTAPATSALYTDWDPTRTIFFDAPGSAGYSVDNSWPSNGDPRWSRAFTFNQSKTFSFSLSNVNTSGSGCALWLETFGDVSSSSPYAMTVTINNTAIPSSPFSWSGNTANVIQQTFPCSQLAQGANTLGVSSSKNTWEHNFHVTYSENLCATSNNLEWSGNGGDFSLGGFSQAPVSVWRVATDANGVGTGSLTRLTGFATGASTNAACTAATSGATFADSNNTSALYLATAAPLSPASIAPEDTTNINSGSAQYLILYNPTTALYGANNPITTLQPLVTLRQASGLTVKEINVNTIYDQYGNGQVNPEAIRSYITFAHDNLGTQYVLLVGGDTFDYHNYLNCPGTACKQDNPNNISVIPTLYDVAVNGVVPSDNLLAVHTGAATDAPEVAIGRFPADTFSQLQVMVNKTVGFATGLNTYAYGNTAVYGAGFEDPTFQPSSDYMATQLPSSFTAGNITKIYNQGSSNGNTFTCNTCTADRTNFLAAVNNGPELVNYSGHGNYKLWGHESPYLFDQTEVTSLTNDNKPFVGFAWGCATTQFTTVNQPNTDEELLAYQHNGLNAGAVLMLGSSGLDYAYPQAVLAGGESGDTGPAGNGYFYGYLKQNRTIGQSLMLAKDDVLTSHPNDQDYLDVVNSYTIEGDPALYLVPGHVTIASYSNLRVNRAHGQTVIRWHSTAPVAGFDVYKGSKKLNSALVTSTTHSYRFVTTVKVSHPRIVAVSLNG